MLFQASTRPPERHSFHTAIISHFRATHPTVNRIASHRSHRHLCPHSRTSRNIVSWPLRRRLFLVPCSPFPISHAPSSPQSAVAIHGNASRHGWAGYASVAIQRPIREVVCPAGLVPRRPGSTRLDSPRRAASLSLRVRPVVTPAGRPSLGERHACCLQSQPRRIIRHCLMLVSLFLWAAWRGGWSLSSLLHDHAPPDICPHSIAI
ncbi:hypothetical protein B0T22DRAFT_86059 [Podospora appendiculata]|uniref:Uncharacterized protein n=1 Tax=Podospora appendiculata TaxID=314037 RepID=A0AAE0XK36_9PEZI|nr:hypothetical protein B0T22DRAFT_86059 [Podospora appendiculata]